MRISLLTISVSLPFAVASGASALPDTTFGFTDLDATYSGGPSQTLTIEAVDSSSLGSSGDVTNFTGGTGQTASFGAGFAGLVSDADVQIAMTLVNITATSADATGSFTVTDDDGDTLSGSFDGQWTNTFGIGFFNGTVSSASFDASQGDSFFEGPGDPNNPQNRFAAPNADLFGGFSILTELPEWFGQSDGFSGASAQADGILIPAPGAIALVGVGGLMAARRRR